MNYPDGIRRGDVEGTVGERSDHRALLLALAVAASLTCAVTGVWTPVTSISAAAFALLLGGRLTTEITVPGPTSGLDEAIERARRSERSFALVDLSSLAPRVYLDQLRATDTMIDLRGRTMLVMPETNHEHVQIFATRVAGPDAVPSLTAQTVYFPADGLTAEALLDRSSTVRTGEKR